MKKVLKKILPENITEKIRDLKKKFGGQMSYSQNGEDLILKSLFREKELKKVSYLDIGAHHPYYLSNTYLLYKSGSTGVCIEPDPFLFSKIKKARKRDLCINAGVGNSDNTTEAEFYIMSAPTLNTFSKSEAENSVERGYKINSEIKIPLVNINDILSEQFSKEVDFVSIDTEGFDLQILKSIDFTKHRPKVFCVETLEYSNENKPRKKVEIVEFMKNNSYVVYADTYINTIFIDKKIF